MRGCWKQYGEVTALLVSKKKNGSAIVEYSRHDAAVSWSEACVWCKCSLSCLIFSFCWLCGYYCMHTTKLMWHLSLLSDWPVTYPAIEYINLWLWLVTKGVITTSDSTQLKTGRKLVIFCPVELSF